MEPHARDQLRPWGHCSQLWGTVRLEAWCPALLPAWQCCCRRGSFLRHTAVPSLHLVFHFPASATDLEKDFCASKCSAFPSCTSSVGEKLSTTYPWCKHLLLACEELGSKSLGQLRMDGPCCRLPGSTALPRSAPVLWYLTPPTGVHRPLPAASNSLRALERCLLCLYYKNARSLDDPAKANSDIHKEIRLYRLEGEDYPHKLTSAFTRIDLQAFTTS